MSERPSEPWYRVVNWGALPGLLACLIPLVLHLTGVAFK